MNLIILGASTRAAAFSAHRAGLKPWCIDLFADADLQALCPVRKVPYSDYPHGLFAALADAPNGPVMYTGGLENYPELLATIDRPLWGNPPEVVRQVRSPYRVSDMLRQHGIPTLEVRAEPPLPGDPRRWLVKPLRGSGGVGIRDYRHGDSFNSRTHYLQPHIIGDCISASYLGVPGRSSILLGTTAALLAPWTHAPEFHYDGSLGPVPTTIESAHTLGELLARECGLVGLFGIDFISGYCHGAGFGFWPIDVNPRYTASMEVLELAYKTTFLDLHCAVFEKQPIHWTPPSAPYCHCAKAVVYSRRDLTFPADGPWLAKPSADPGNGHSIYADIPHAGERIPHGKPVLTVLTTGAQPSPWSLYQLVERHVEALDRHLYG